jgi:lysophospholipase
MLAASTMTAPEPAPYLAEIAEGPDGARAWWVTSADGTRLRLGVWQAEGRGAGHGPAVPGAHRIYREIRARGPRPRGEGLHGRGLRLARPGARGPPAASPRHGPCHQLRRIPPGRAAFRHALETLGLPGPYHLIAHSMGGAIGLRALHDGLPVKAAAFSAPMWGIQMTPFLKSIAGIVLASRGPSASAPPSRPPPARGSRWNSTTTR